MRFPERRFAAAGARRIGGSWSAFLRGSALVRRSPAILVMVAATFLINGAAVFGLLQTRRLVQLGFPVRPILWFTGLGILTLLAGAGVFRLAEPHVGERAARRTGLYAGALGGVRGCHVGQSLSWRPCRSAAGHSGGGGQAVSPAPKERQASSIWISSAMCGGNACTTSWMSADASTTSSAF